MDKESEEAVKEVLDQNPERRKDPKNPFLINAKGLTLSRVLRIGKGAYNTEWLEINGQQIPMRLLSIEEEDTLRFETMKEFKNQSSIYFGMKDDVGLYERLYMIKSVSLSTTLNPDSGVSPYLTEKDIKAMPNSSFAALLWHYQRLEKEYNPRVGEVADEEVDFLIGELLDPEKKSIFMDGLTFLQMRAILLVFLEYVTNLGANIGTFSSLDNLLKGEAST